MVTLVDRPPVRIATVDALVTAFERALDHRKWAVVPEYNSTHGHPILLAREMLTAFLNAPESSNAREVEHAHQSDIEYLPLDDPRHRAQCRYSRTIRPPLAERPQPLPT